MLDFYFTNMGFLSALRFFPTAGDKSFWKVESCPRGGPHTVSELCADHIQLLGAGRHTHTHLHTLTKWRL